MNAGGGAIVTMAFQITITAIANVQLRSLPARDQSVLKSAITDRLIHQPDIETKSVKRLRPNSVAAFQLCVGRLRILSSLPWGARSGTNSLLKVKNSMSIKKIQFKTLEQNLTATLSECADSGEVFVIELPDHRLVAIQTLESTEEEGTLMDDLIESNQEFRTLLEKSKNSPRQPFEF